MARSTDDIISQKIFLNELRTVEFHMQCLEDSGQAANKEALEEYCDVGLLNSKILAYRKLCNLDNILDKTEVALEECSMLDLASQYVSRLQLEAIRLKMISSRLDEENELLSKENRLLKARIKQLHLKIATADADMQQYLLMCQIRRTDFFNTDSKLVRVSIERDIKINNSILSHLSSQFKAFYPLVLQYINTGRFEIATSLCKQSRNGKKLTSADHALITYILALAALRQRNSEEAVKLFESSCKIMSNFLGDDDKCLVPLLSGYGKALRLAGRYEESVAVLSRALSIKNLAREREDEELWYIQVDIASNLIKMNKSEEASQILFDTLNLATHVLSSEETIIVLIRNYLARCYMGIGQSNEALDMITGIIEKVFEHDGFPSIPSVLKNPDAFQVTRGTDLATVCEQTKNTLELFTCQTLNMIYMDMKNEKSSDILSEYIRLHSVDYEIE